MRHTALRTARATLRAGSSDSAAAIVTTSRPPKANATARTPETTPCQPLGRKPPCPVRLASPTASVSGSTPKIASRLSSRNSTIAPTFSVANQNSNSPKLLTAVRLAAVNTSMKISTQPHCGTAGTHPLAICAAPVASTASTTTSRNQYSQPTLKPAQRPSARSACTEKAPDAGIAEDISPSIRMISMASAPAIRYERTMPGPATAMPAPEPTNRPAPITPPSPSMVRWRCLSPADSGSRPPAPSPGGGVPVAVGASCMGSYSRKGLWGNPTGSRVVPPVSPPVTRYHKMRTRPGRWP